MSQTRVPVVLLCRLCLLPVTKRAFGILETCRWVCPLSMNNFVWSWIGFSDLARSTTFRGPGNQLNVLHLIKRRFRGFSMEFKLHFLMSSQLTEKTSMAIDVHRLEQPVRAMNVDAEAFFVDRGLVDKLTTERSSLDAEAEKEQPELFMLANRLRKT